MSFKDKIPGCFGSADKIFSGHYNDTERAKNMLIEALQEKHNLGQSMKRQSGITLSAKAVQKNTSRSKLRGQEEQRAISTTINCQLYASFWNE